MSKPRKPYRPRDPAQLKLKYRPWTIAAVFNPLIEILDQLEQEGTIDETTAGQAVFKGRDGYWYDTAAAVLGVVEAYEIHEVRTQVSLGLTPLRQLANKLQYSMPVFQADVDQCRACLARMKAATCDMTAGYAQELLNDYRIKEGLERAAA